MLKKILLVEDEEEFARTVLSYLQKCAFFVTRVSSGKEALDKLQNGPFDLVVLDLGLPDRDGLEVCQKIRKKNGIPILILTGRDGVEDKVIGLNSGADDYLVKPISLKELAVRIERLFSRNFKDTFRTSSYQFDKIQFDTLTGRLKAGKRSLILTKKEKAILEYLLLKKGQVLTGMEIMDHIWGEEINPFSNSVNMLISSLRRKLYQLSGKSFIQSVHGLGYKLI